MKTTASLLLLILAATHMLQAAARTSVSYAITADIADNGGTRTTSAAYTNDASIGGITEVSAAAAPAETAKAGYIGLGR